MGNEHAERLESTAGEMVRARVDVEPGQAVPVDATIRVGRAVELRIPVGAYVRRGERVCFVPTIDVVGLTAVVLGIGTGLRLGAQALGVFEAWVREGRAGRR